MSSYSHSSHSKPHTSLYEIHHSHVPWKDGQRRYLWYALAVLGVVAIGVAILIAVVYGTPGGLLWNKSNGGNSASVALSEALQKASAGTTTAVNSNGLIIPVGWGKNIFPQMVYAQAGLDSAKIGVYGQYLEAGLYASDLVTNTWPGVMSSVLRNGGFNDGGMGYIPAANTPFAGSKFTGWQTSASHVGVDITNNWNLGGSIGFGPGAAFVISNKTYNAITTMTFYGSGRYVVIEYGQNVYEAGGTFYVTLGSTAAGVLKISALTSDSPNAYGTFPTYVIDAGQYFQNQTVTLTQQALSEIVIAGVRFMTTYNFDNSNPQPASGVIVDNWSNPGSSGAIGNWLQAPNQFWSGPDFVTNGLPDWNALYYSGRATDLSIISLGRADTWCGNNMANVMNEYTEIIWKLGNLTNQDFLLVFPMFVTNPNYPTTVSTTSCPNNGASYDVNAVNNYQSLITYAKTLAASSGMAVWDVGASNTWAGYNTAGYWGSGSPYGITENNAFETSTYYLSNAGHAYMGNYIAQIISGQFSGGACC
jgi:hypothetical protein